MKLPAIIADTVTIEKEDPETSLWISKEMPGFLGPAYEFQAGGENEEAEITFSFDPSLADTDEFDPLIYFVDGEKQEMYALEEQTVDWENHTVTAKIGGTVKRTEWH